MPLQIPQQELFSPVTNYYKGKAIRQDLATAKKQEELLDLQIAEAKKPPKVDPKEQRDAENHMKDSLAEGFAVAEMIRQKGGSESEWTEAFNNSLSTSTNPEVLAEMVKLYDKNGDKILGPNELDMGVAFAISRGQELQEKTKPTANMQVLDDLVDQEFMTQEERNTILKRQQEKAATIVGRTPEDVSADPRTGSQIGASYQGHLDQYNQSSDLTEMIGSTLPRVLDNPLAVGTRGKGTILGSGFLRAMGQDELADGFSQWMSGATDEEVANIMAQLQAVRGQLLPIVTGQESRARLSDEERRVGDRAVALIEEVKGPADLTKSYPMIVGAVRQFYEETWAKKYRIASYEPGINYPYDLGIGAERRELMAEFREAGIDDAGILRAMTRLAKIQGVEIK